jgi:hypothetical protein
MTFTFLALNATPPSNFCVTSHHLQKKVVQPALEMEMIEQKAESNIQN